MCSCFSVCSCDMLTQPCFPPLCPSRLIFLSLLSWKTPYCSVISFSPWLKILWCLHSTILSNLSLFTLHSPSLLLHILLLPHLYFPISSCSCFVLAQCVLEEIASRETELGRLRERAHRLWEGQAAGKGFVHRVSQLSAQYLALSNLTKVTLLPPCNPAPPLSTYLCFCLRTPQQAEMCLAWFI